MSASPRIMLLTLVVLAQMASSSADAVPRRATGTMAPLRMHVAELESPMGIAVAGERIYVADFDHDQVLVLAGDGQVVGRWGESGSGPGQLRGPAGVAVGPDGSVFVTDLYNHRVQRFAADGLPLGSLMAEADAAPFGIAVARSGRVYATDLDGGRVLSWSADGTSLESWGTRGGGRGELSEPWGIAVDGLGDVYVADHGNHRVQRFSSDGEWLAVWGEAGVGEGQLLGPMGIAVDRDGSVHVTDLVADRVRRFTRGGELVALWQGAADGGGAGSAAAGLALDAEGTLLVADPMHHDIARIAEASAAAAEPAPTAFALLPIARPVGEGPFTIELAIPAAGTLGAEFYSLDGRRVHTLPGSPCDAGLQRIRWDARTDEGRFAPAGMYFVRVQYENGGQRIARTARLVVLR